MTGTKLKPPSVLFPREMVFDDGKHRVELMHLGVAHTRGDAFAWLPKEGILLTGDACVNGPYNFVGDGDVEKWVPTLEAARKLGARVVCPGHGPRGADTMLVDQQEYFVSLRERVGALVQAKKSGQDVRDSIETDQRGAFGRCANRVLRRQGGRLCVAGRESLHGDDRTAIVGS